MDRSDPKFMIYLNDIIEISDELDKKSKYK